MRSSPERSGLSRRAALAAPAALLGGCGRSPSVPSRVTIHRVPRYDDALYEAVRRMFREQKLDLGGRRVLLKPNLVEFEAGVGINTHPMVVHAVFEACQAAGAAEVRIGEGPGHRRSSLDLASAAGYFTTVPKFESVFTDLNLDEVAKVGLRSPRSKLDSLYLPKTALGADLVVSIAKMKTHHWVGATLSMKNLFGLVPGAVYGWPKNILHVSGLEESIADLHGAFPRHFAIVDGIDAMEGNGPIQGERKHVGVLVAGRDMVAVDATCCRIMGIDPARVRYLTLADGAGTIAEAGIVQTGEAVAAVRSRFRVIPELRRLLVAG
jgi:uncharacterized protein (DUF362 family)